MPSSTLESYLNHSQQQRWNIILGKMIEAEELLDEAEGWASDARDPETLLQSLRGAADYVHWGIEGISAWLNPSPAET